MRDEITLTGYPDHRGGRRMIDDTMEIGAVVRTLAAEGLSIVRVECRGGLVHCTLQVDDAHRVGGRTTRPEGTGATLASAAEDARLGWARHRDHSSDDARSLSRDAAIVAAAIAAAPGITGHDLQRQCSARARAAGMPRGMGTQRIGSAIVSLGHAVLRSRGPRGATPHYLDGSLVSADVLALVADSERSSVAASRVPKGMLRYGSLSPHATRDEITVLGQRCIRDPHGRSVWTSRVGAVTRVAVLLEPDGQWDVTLRAGDGGDVCEGWGPTLEAAEEHCRGKIRRFIEAASGMVRDA